MLEEDTLFIVNCNSAQVSCLEWVGLWGWLGRDMAPMCLSREEEKEHEPSWEKANLDRYKKG